MKLFFVSMQNRKLSIIRVTKLSQRYFITSMGSELQGIFVSIKVGMLTINMTRTRGFFLKNFSRFATSLHFLGFLVFFARLQLRFKSSFQQFKVHPLSADHKQSFPSSGFGSSFCSI